MANFDYAANVPKNVVVFVIVIVIIIVNLIVFKIVCENSNVILVSVLIIFVKQTNQNKS